jgi:hypothetical protein
VLELVHVPLRPSLRGTQCVLFEQHLQLYYAMLISLAVIGTVQIALIIFLQYRGASVLERLAKTFVLTSSTMGAYSHRNNGWVFLHQEALICVV